MIGRHSPIPTIAFLIGVVVMITIPLVRHADQPMMLAPAVHEIGCCNIVLPHGEVGPRPSVAPGSRTGNAR